MAVTITGVRVDAIHLEFNPDSGMTKIDSAQYSLISSAGKVLAKQTIGGYQGMAIEPSPATLKAMDAFSKSYISDVQAILGLME